MVILSGKKNKELIMKQIKDKVSKLDRKPTLAVISTMNDSSSDVYINSKKRMCEFVGYDFKEFRFDKIEEKELISLIERLNKYDDIDGILLQLPVCIGIDCERVINYINYRKDVDGITDINMGRLLNNNPYLCSCTSLGIIRLLEFYKIDIRGKNVVIVGRSRLVGKTLASMFLNKDATVTICHSKTKNLEFYTKNADILVAAVGKSNFIKKELVKDNAVVIDVGINRLDDGSIVGDVDYDGVLDKVDYITPVPGGVGQMTVAILCENIYKAYINRV